MAYKYENFTFCYIGLMDYEYFVLHAALFRWEYVHGARILPFSILWYTIICERLPNQYCDCLLSYKAFIINLEPCYMCNGKKMANRLDRHF